MILEQIARLRLHLQPPRRHGKRILFLIFGLVINSCTGTKEVYHNCKCLKAISQAVSFDNSYISIKIAVGIESSYEYHVDSVLGYAVIRMKTLRDIVYETSNVRTFEDYIFRNIALNKEIIISKSLCNNISPYLITIEDAKKYQHTNTLHLLKINSKGDFLPNLIDSSKAMSYKSKCIIHNLFYNSIVVSHDDESGFLTWTKIR